MMRFDTTLATIVAVCVIAYVSYRTGVNEACVMQAKLARERDLSYAQSIEVLKQQHAQELETLADENKQALDELRNSYSSNNDHGLRTVDSGGAPASANTDKRFVCFERDDFYARLERSMAIASRADKVTADYKLLLKMVETNNAQK